MEAIGLSGLIIGSIALIISCVALSIVVGIKNSTHRIEWQAIDPPDTKSSGPAIHRHNLDSTQDMVNNSLKEFAKIHDNFEHEQV